MILLKNELKSQYRNGSLDCLSDMTQIRAEPVQGLSRPGKSENKIQGLSRTGTCPVYMSSTRYSQKGLQTKDFQGPSSTDSRTFKDHVHFQGLSRPGKSENKIQGLSRTDTCPVYMSSCRYSQKGLQTKVMCNLLLTCQAIEQHR